jgi:hypothetical protein
MKLNLLAGETVSSLVFRPVPRSVAQPTHRRRAEVNGKRCHENQFTYH